MKVEEIAKKLGYYYPVVSYREANYGMWVFHVAVEGDLQLEVRIRKFPRTKEAQCIHTLVAAIEKQITDLREGEEDVRRVN